MWRRPQRNAREKPRSNIAIAVPRVELPIRLQTTRWGGRMATLRRCRAALLAANPLGGQRRTRSSAVSFANTDVWVRDIAQTIEDAIARAHPTDGKVTLVSYSLGTLRVGRADDAHGTRAGRREREDGAPRTCGSLCRVDRRRQWRAGVGKALGRSAFHSHGGTGRVDHRRDIRRCAGRPVHHRCEWRRQIDWNLSQP
jgi:hypothetical protein